MTRLAADPYYFNTSRYIDKDRHIRDDVRTIRDFLDKNENEIFEASKSYIGREEHLYLFTSAMKFWQNATEVQLTGNGTNLATLVSIFCAESILGVQIVGNNDRFRNFLLNFLTRDEKIELISGYCFGVPYRMGQGRFRKKHLCHRAAILDNLGYYANQSYCTSGDTPLCGCRDWLNRATDKKINKYLNMLGTYLYRMRNSVVHDAGFVQFTSMPFQSEGIGEVVPTMSDAFSHHATKQYTSYDTDITMQRFAQIMKNAAWRCFQNGSRARTYAMVDILRRP